MNDYIDMLIDRVKYMLEENRGTMTPEDALEEIIRQDDANGSRTFDRAEAREFYEKALDEDWKEARNFGAWVDDAGLSAEAMMYYIGGDYERLDILAEIYTAETCKNKIIAKAK